MESRWRVDGDLNRQMSAVVIEFVVKKDGEERPGKVSKHWLDSGRQGVATVADVGGCGIRLTRI
jgi:hypothetical protein